MATVTRTDHNQTFDKNGNLLTDNVVVTDITPQANLATIVQQAQTARTNNTAYLAIGSPTNAQVVAQVNALTVQNNKIIRVLLYLAGITGTLDDVT